MNVPKVPKGSLLFFTSFDYHLNAHNWSSKLIIWRENLDRSVRRHIPKSIIIVQWKTLCIRIKIHAEKTHRASILFFLLIIVCCKFHITASYKNENVCREGCPCITRKTVISSRTIYTIDSKKTNDKHMNKLWSHHAHAYLHHQEFTFFSYHRKALQAYDKPKDLFIYTFYQVFVFNKH